MEGLYDQSFNLTTSYRRDSDIPRPFGTAEKSLLDARFMMVTEENEETGEITTRYEEVQTGDENIQSIMDWKDNEGKFDRLQLFSRNNFQSRGDLKLQCLVKFMYF